MKRRALWIQWGLDWLRKRWLGLEVALHKIEAVTFQGPRRRPPQGLAITVEVTRIALRAQMKYLGLTLANRWGFATHFQALTPKLMGATRSLSQLLPNVGGPGAV